MGHAEDCLFNKGEPAGCVTHTQWREVEHAEEQHQDRNGQALCAASQLLRDGPGCVWGAATG
jgi:hypothetical protein